MDDPHDPRYTIVTCNNDYGDFRSYTGVASGIGEIAQRAYSQAEDADRWVVSIIETDYLPQILAATVAPAEAVLANLDGR